MRIDDTNRSGVAPGVTRSPNKREKAAATGPRTVVDSLSIMGIPSNELTPKVRDAIMTLMAEVDRMRGEVEEQHARIAYLERLADQDSLTPVVNRRAFVRELSRFVSYGERYGTPSSVIYFDLNGLKGINDSHGHAAGDAALQRVAQILTENVRDSDIVGRLGGDEFGVLLAHADEAAATEKALQLVDSIENTSIDWDGTSIPLKVAFGAYTFKGGVNASEALAEADKKMYAQKHAGKVPVPG
jgi:diguanylate cyclase (GGDEF)-like protein